jgi:multidrug resistance efflux pump
LKLSFHKKEKNPNIVQGMKVPYAPAKRQAAKWRWYLILFIVASPLLYFLLKLILAQVIVTAQGFISLEKVAVNSNSAGTIQKLYVEVGQELVSGSMIAQLYNADLSSQKIMLESELSALDHPEISYDPAQEVLLRKRIRLIKEVLNFAQKYFANVNFLFNQGAATVAELDLARERKTKAELDHYHAWFELGRLLEGRQKYPQLPEVKVVKKRRQIKAKVNIL